MKKSALFTACAVIPIVLMANIGGAEEITQQRVSRADPLEPATAWIALAADPTGRTFKTDSARNNEEAARSAAKALCERTTARTCGVTISVREDWDVVVVKCAGNKIFMGASAQGNASDYAYGKATNAGISPSTYTQVANY
jgi:hypothetical protein